MIVEADWDAHYEGSKGKCDSRVKADCIVEVRGQHDEKERSRR